MPGGHQLIIDCGLNGAANCQLAADSLSAINIQAQQAATQYNYYLLVNNQLQDSCQLSLKANADQGVKEYQWSKIFVKIYYQDQVLFNANLQAFFQQNIDLLNIAIHSFRLYRFEFYLTEIGDEFQLNFSLNFHLNCQQIIAADQQEQKILGFQTEQKEAQFFEPLLKAENHLSKQRVFLFLSLFILIVFLGLIFLIYRPLFGKSRKLLISSKKGKSMSKNKKIKKLGLGLLLTLALTFGALRLSKALFSDVETLKDNTAGAASVNLKLGGQDPTQVSFSFPNLIPGEPVSSTIAVTDIGSGADFNENLYIGLVVTDSDEGINSEAETDIEGDGELAECLMVRVSYLDLANNEVEVQPYTSFSQLQSTFIDEQNLSPLDNLLQITTVNLTFDFSADACGNEAMGDTVTFDLNFYYEQ